MSHVDKTKFEVTVYCQEITSSSNHVVAYKTFEMWI